MIEPVLTATLLAQNWPAFRGAGTTGAAPTATPPVSWDLSSSRNVAWKTISGNLLIVRTLTQLVGIRS